MPATAADRLAADTANIIGKAATAEDRFGVAVSGGPDSLALLLMAAQAFPGRIAAATVDHGLRRESGAEAAFVSDICSRLDVPHAILRPDTPIVGNIQSAARRVRYQLLERWAAHRRIDWILTAHHADDQVETMIMRLQRGAGLSGVAGIRRHNGRRLRPLLGWRRDELVALVTEAGMTAIVDPSNSDLRFDRAAIRQHLAASHWITPPAWANSAAWLDEAETALDWTVTKLLSSRVRAEVGLITLDLMDLPVDLQRRLVVKALASLGERPSRGPALTRALKRIAAGNATMLGNVILKPADGRLKLFAAPPRKPSQPGS